MSGVDGDAHPQERNEDAKSAGRTEPDADHQSKECVHESLLDRVSRLRCRNRSGPPLHFVEPQLPPVQKLHHCVPAAEPCANLLTRKLLDEGHVLPKAKMLQTGLGAKIFHPGMAPGVE